MKYKLFGVLIFFVLFSCEKYSYTPLPANPAWLNVHIADLESETAFGKRIEVYLWRENYYYHFYNPVSSCLFCNFYDYYGNRYSWNWGDMENFFESSELLGYVWEDGY